MCNDKVNYSQLEDILSYFIIIQREDNMQNVVSENYKILFTSK